MNFNTSSVYELYGLCDASRGGYAAVVYIQTFNPVTVMLVAKKSRITTSSAATLPRLELPSALLLSNFIQVVKDPLPYSVYETFMFSDSTIALSYYLKLPTKRNQFVFH